MCGLFGAIRPHRYPPHLRGVAASALLDLGYLAEERGTDSAGLATLHRRTLTDHPTGSDCTVRETTTGHWRSVTTLGPFSQRLPDHPRLRSNLQTARLAGVDVRLLADLVPPPGGPWAGRAAGQRP
jgi:hypothetical protein